MAQKTFKVPSFEVSELSRIDLAIGEMRFSPFIIISSYIIVAPRSIYGPMHCQSSHGDQLNVFFDICWLGGDLPGRRNSHRDPLLFQGFQIGRRVKTEVTFFKPAELETLNNFCPSRFFQVCPDFHCLKIVNLDTHRCQDFLKCV